MQIVMVLVPLMLLLVAVGIVLVRLGRQERAV